MEIILTEKGVPMRGAEPKVSFSATSVTITAPNEL